jgi:exosortase
LCCFVPDAAIIEPPRLTAAALQTSSTARLALACAACGVLWFILCRQLANEWEVNEQYSYGWFVPFFAAYLFWLRWEDRASGAGGLAGSTADGSGAKAGPLQHHDRPVRKLENGRAKLEEDGARASAFLLPTSSFDARSPARSPASLAGLARLPKLLPLACVLLFLLLPLRLFEVGNPDWRPLSWVHAVVVVALTLSLLWVAGGWRWVKHFAFPVAFILVAVPWITPIEAPIVQGLMRIVAAISTETLALFGVPAQLEGSVIRISSGVVGVNEACSGVRSLQTSLMIGLLFGELKRLSVARRIALVAAAAAIAFIANCARAFFLVWVAAHDGVAAVDKWHDAAGYAILGAVFLGTIGVAALLQDSGIRNRESDVANGENAHTSGDDITALPEPTPAARPLTSSPFLLPTSYFLLCLLWLLAIEVAVEAWYRAGERDLVATQRWDVRWPETSAGFRELKIDDTVEATLRFDEGRQATWRASSSPAIATRAATETWSMFFFRWQPGSTSILRARAHRPDICLPNVGWRMAADHGVRPYPVTDGVHLPFRHFTFVREIPSQRAVFAHAFFCQREDRVRLDEAPVDATSGAIGGWARSDRLGVVLQGWRNQGQQVLQLIMVTPENLSIEAAQAEFAELVPKIVTVEH